MEFSYRKVVSGILTLGLTAAVWGADVKQEKPSAGHAWTYRGAHGANHWGEINPEYANCSLGKAQSPIDIRGAVKADLESINFDYKPSALRVLNNGHTIQFNYDPGSSITVGGKQYALVQFHFHKPSEEEINGKRYAMVVHLVHKNEEGRLAVVAVLFRSGKANPFIKTLWKHVSEKVDQENVAEGVTINAADLLPANRGYYTFMGSLTTPPCSEDVTWFVLKSPVHLSHAQVNRFGKLYPNNARPVQALNGREIKETR